MTKVDREFELLRQIVILKINNVLFKLCAPAFYGFIDDSYKELDGESFLAKGSRSLGGIQYDLKDPSDHFVTIRHRGGDKFKIFVTQKLRMKSRDRFSRDCRFKEIPKIVLEGIDYVKRRDRDVNF